MIASGLQSFLDGVTEILPLADALNYASIFGGSTVEEAGQLRVVAERRQRDAKT